MTCLAAIVQHIDVFMLSTWFWLCLLYFLCCRWLMRH